MSATTLLLPILILAVGTYAFRIVGPAVHGRVRLPRFVDDLLGDGAIVLLSALTVTSAVFEAGQFAGWARPIGVAVAGALAIIKAPFPVIVVSAALVTALLRLIFPGIDG
jgi:branched-subunit amino acid transport protein